VQSYEEGKALLETNSGLVNFWFFTGCANVLGELSTYDFEKALLIDQILIDAVDLLEGEEERKNALGWCLSAQASIYLGQFRREEALHLYEQALALFETLPEHLPGVAATCSNLGDIYADRGEYDDALLLYEKSIALYQEMKAPLGEGKAQRDIGDIYVRMGRYAEAEVQYGKALSLIQKLLLSTFVVKQKRSISKVSVMHYRSSRLSLKNSKSQKVNFLLTITLSLR